MFNWKTKSNIDNNEMEKMSNIVSNKSSRGLSTDSSSSS